MDLQGGPTFEDLSIDDELTQLQRLVRYSSSSIALQRLVHVKVRTDLVAPMHLALIPLNPLSLPKQPGKQQQPELNIELSLVSCRTFCFCGVSKKQQLFSLSSSTVPCSRTHVDAPPLLDA